jgi:Cu(I)/Ag(I) efflux system membrane protein CusA/SilA
MKPLAAPVLGGMVSSLLHVLIVTPVIFFWLQERRLGLQPLPSAEPRRPVRWRPLLAAAAVVVLVVSSVAVWRGTRGGPAATDGAIVQRVQADGVEVVLSSPGGVLRVGRNAFTIEFRSADGRLVDAGGVRATGTMTMPGMVMTSGMKVEPTGVKGRYAATAEFGMAGAWQLALEWDGPDGRGAVTFEGNVQ